jgi:hypothetical protein
VKTRGKVRRSRLLYLRQRAGKAARIRDRFQLARAGEDAGNGESAATGGDEEKAES